MKTIRERFIDELAKQGYDKASANELIDELFNEAKGELATKKESSYQIGDITVIVRSGHATSNI